MSETTTRTSESNPLLASVLQPLTGALAVVAQGDTAPVEGLSGIPATSSIPDKLKPVAPAWMVEADLSAAAGMATKLVEAVQESPADIRLLAQAQKLGEEGARHMTQPLKLYERKVAGVLAVGQEGNSAQVTLLEVQRQMDTINPAVLRKQSVPVRFTFGLVSTFPNADKVLDWIYERRATVMSTVNGLVENLRIDADNLEANLEDLSTIYRGLIDGQRLVERDIYVGQLVIRVLTEHLESMADGPERDNVSQFVADLTTQVIFLMDEEYLNLQFFAGAQAVAKLTMAQLHILRNLGRLLTRSVLANLGLNVAARELERSMQLSAQLGQAISNTVADTAGSLKGMGDRMNEVRKKGGLDLVKLEEACTSMEQFFEAQATANATIIETGRGTMQRLADMSGRLNRRVQSGHDGMTA